MVSAERLPILDELQGRCMLPRPLSQKDEALMPARSDVRIPLRPLVLPLAPFITQAIHQATNLSLETDR